MSKTPVRLEAKGIETREVQEVSYKFNQAIDKENQPAGIPRGGLITIKCKALNGSEGLGDLVNWMTSKTMAKDGEIIFMQSADADKELKRIKFTQAYCVEFEEHWEDQTENTGLAHWEKITISCKTMDVAGAAYENQWA